MALSGTAVSLITIGLLFAFMLLSVPVFVAMGLSAFIGFLLVEPPHTALASLGTVLWQSANIFQLVAIPLFLFTGILISRIGAGRDLFDVTKAWVGGLPNSLGVATIGACGIFATITGSSVATAATLGLVAIPLLLEEQYTPAQAGGFVAGGGTLGIIFPPSIPFILYGVVTETSIGKLFMAGVIPGIIMMFVFSLYVMVVSRPRIRTRNILPLREKLRVTYRGMGVLLLPVVIIGAIYTGIFAPTEVAALAVVYVVVLGLVQRRLTVRQFISAGAACAKTTAMLLMLIIFGQYFGHLLTQEQLPQQIAQWVAVFHGNAFLIVTMMVLAYIVLGVFLEAAAMLLISIPIFFPIAASVGMNATTFGVFACIAMEIAQIHPPIGINLFTIHGITKIPLWQLSKGALPFLLVQVAMLYAVFYFPQLSLWLPGHMK